jgi:hypothetical protein
MKKPALPAFLLSVVLREGLEWRMTAVAYQGGTDLLLNVRFLPVHKLTATEVVGAGCV